MTDRDTTAMNNPNTPEDDSRDSQLAAAVDVIRGTPVPPDAMNRVTRAARALRSDTTVRVHTSHRPDCGTAGISRRAMALAAVLATLGIALLILPGIFAQRRATAAFAEVIELAKEAKSVRLTITERFGPGRIRKTRHFVAGKRSRLEMIDGPLVIVFDMDRGEQLLLDTANKFSEVSHAKELSVSVDLVEHLARVAEEGVEPVSGKPDTFRGKWVPALRLAKIQRDMTVVVDHDSRLPTRILIRSTDPKSPSETVFDDFHWNEPIDESLLSVDPPEGYEARVGLIQLLARPWATFRNP